MSCCSSRPPPPKAKPAPKARAPSPGAVATAPTVVALTVPDTKAPDSQTLIGNQMGESIAGHVCAAEELQSITKIALQTAQSDIKAGAAENPPLAATEQEAKPAADKSTKLGGSLVVSNLAAGITEDDVKVISPNGVRGALCNNLFQDARGSASRVVHSLVQSCDLVIRCRWMAKSCIWR